MINYNNKIFETVQNSENGGTSAATVFHYTQEGNILTGRYTGGPIIKGQLIGIIDNAGDIDMRYHQVNHKKYGTGWRLTF